MDSIQEKLGGEWLVQICQAPCLARFRFKGFVVHGRDEDNR